MWSTLAVFHRISDIVKQAMPHDSHVLMLLNRAGHVTLCQAVAKGRFRNDLSYRLQVFDIQLPALRERRGDVLLLAEHFLRAFADTSGGTPARLSDKACDALVAHTWPGNIRELRNVLETAAILNEEGVIEPCHLSLQSTVPVAAETQDLQTIERRMIERVLQQTGWNKARTARQLGLTRTQLYGRLRRLGLENRYSIRHRPSSVQATRQ